MADLDLGQHSQEAITEVCYAPGTYHSILRSSVSCPVSGGARGGQLLAPVEAAGRHSGPLALLRLAHAFIQLQAIYPIVSLQVEADSYWCLCKLLDGIQDHYTYAQPGIQRTVFHLKELVRCALHLWLERFRGIAAWT